MTCRRCGEYVYMIGVDRHFRVRDEDGLIHRCPDRDRSLGSVGESDWPNVVESLRAFAAKVKPKAVVHGKDLPL